MSEFLLDPWPWVEGTVLEDYYDADGAGFFHVTTQAGLVKTAGRLLSRRETGKIALGGGGAFPMAGEDPDRVSFLFDVDRALWLWSAVRTMSRVATGAADMAEGLDALLQWTEFAEGGSEWGRYQEELLDPEQDWENVIAALLDELDFERPSDNELWTSSDWNRLVVDHADELCDKFPTPQLAYDALRDFESSLNRIITDRGEGFGDYYDGSICLPFVGFTAPWEKFSKISPDEISVVQAAVQEGVDANMEVGECELRFRPQHVEIVRYRIEESGPELE